MDLSRGTRGVVRLLCLSSPSQPSTLVTLSHLHTTVRRAAADDCRAVAAYVLLLPTSTRCCCQCCEPFIIHERPSGVALECAVLAALVVCLLCPLSPRMHFGFSWGGE